MLHGEIVNALTSARPGLIATYQEALSSRHYARRTIATYERWLRVFRTGGIWVHTRRAPHRQYRR